jgi:glycosyltransferase involved in cell wall biosynthesis
MPKLSVVIPVFNEEAILETAVRALTARLDKAGLDHELILAENGSTDRTAEIAEVLAAELDAVRTLHTGAANYGLALKEGIRAARGEWVVCDEIDLGDLNFYHRAIEELAHGADMVIGSKRHPESMDGRPWLRRRGTAVINGLLRLTLDFKGTDTHGLKAFKRERLLPVVEACTVEHNLFASELVIRAGLMGLEVREIPLKLKEIRPPSVGLLRRVPHVLTDLARLIYVIRFKGP